MITGFEYVMGTFFFIDKERHRHSCREDIGEIILETLRGFHSVNEVRNEAENKQRRDGAYAPSVGISKRPAAAEVYEGCDESGACLTVEEGSTKGG